VASAKVSEQAPDATRVGRVPLEAPPVFVDDTGRRRRWLWRVVVGLAVLLVVAGSVVWLSQVGRPVGPAPVVTCAPDGDRDAPGCQPR
jgi:hypothetical protein